MKRTLQPSPPPPSGDPSSPDDPGDSSKRDWKHERTLMSEKKNLRLTVTCSPTTIASTVTPTITATPTTVSSIATTTTSTAFPISAASPDFDLSLLVQNLNASLPGQMVTMPSHPVTLAAQNTHGQVQPAFNFQVGEMGDLGVYATNHNTPTLTPTLSTQLIIQPTLPTFTSTWPRLAPDWSLPPHLFFSQFNKTGAENFTKSLNVESFMKANRIPNVQACRVWQRGECNQGDRHTNSNGLSLIHACILCLQVSGGVPMFHKLVRCPLVIKPKSRR